MPEPRGNNHELTASQARFVDEYLIDLNGKQAAIRAGYSSRTAESQASRLLRNVNVAAAVAERQKALSEKTEITAEKVIAELAKLGFANMADYMKAEPGQDPHLDFSGLTRDQAAALVEVTVEDFKDGHGKHERDVRRVKFRLADKRAALVDLGKHLGLFRERVELTGKDGAPIGVEVSDVRERIASRIARLATGGAAKPDPGGTQ